MNSGYASTKVFLFAVKSFTVFLTYMVMNFWHQPFYIYPDEWATGNDLTLWSLGLLVLPILILGYIFEGNYKYVKMMALGNLVFVFYHLILCIWQTHPAYEYNPSVGAGLWGLVLTGLGYFVIFYLISTVNKHPKS